MQQGLPLPRCGGPFSPQTRLDRPAWPDPGPPRQVCASIQPLGPCWPNGSRAEALKRPRGGPERTAHASSARLGCLRLRAPLLCRADRPYHTTRRALIPAGRTDPVWPASAAPEPPLPIPAQPLKLQQNHRAPSSPQAVSRAALAHTRGIGEPPTLPCSVPWCSTPTKLFQPDARSHLSAALHAPATLCSTGRCARS